MHDSWLANLKVDPRPWLIDEADPAVRHVALRDLFDRDESDGEVVEARAAAMRSDPIATILANQAPPGYWAHAGATYVPKYQGTVWQVIFLAQLGADGADDGVRRGCEYVIAHSQATTGGFGVLGGKSGGPPPPSMVVHCLNGNLVRALIDLGWLDDARVQAAIEWEARAITGAGDMHYLQSGTPGPGFACSANEKRPCAWGAIKAMLGLAAIPRGRRSPLVEQALAMGREFLLSRDPAVADYPSPDRAPLPNRSWFKLGFPSGYVADVLQNLEALCEMGAAGDPRIDHAVEFVLAKQRPDGRWKNEYAYSGKLWADIDRQGQTSKWVTLRACRVLKKVAAARSGDRR